MELETVWTGSTWRSYPQPVIGSLRHAAERPSDELRLGCGGKPTTVHGRALVAAANQARVFASFTDDWQSANQLADRVAMTVQGVRRHLRSALTERVAEVKVMPSARAFGPSVRLYRRVRPAQEAA